MKTKILGLLAVGLLAGSTTANAAFLYSFSSGSGPVFASFTVPNIITSAGTIRGVAPIVTPVGPFVFAAAGDPSGDNFCFMFGSAGTTANGPCNVAGLDTPGEFGAGMTYPNPFSVGQYFSQLGSFAGAVGGIGDDPAAISQAIFNGLRVLSISQTGVPVVIPVSSQATYLRTSEEFAAIDSIPIELASLGFAAGDTIRLQVLGDYSFELGNTPDEVTRLIAVFSSSVSMLSSENLDRVPGAVDTGADYETFNTFFGDLSTDISQDFLITDTIVQIPFGALYLFVAPEDAFYSDNGDPDGDFALRITTIPEPGTLALLGLGLLGLGLTRRRAN